MFAICIDLEAEAICRLRLTIRARISRPKVVMRHVCECFPSLQSNQYKVFGLMTLMSTPKVLVGALVVAFRFPYSLASPPLTCSWPILGSCSWTLVVLVRFPHAIGFSCARIGTVHVALLKTVGVFLQDHLHMFVLYPNRFVCNK